MGKYNSLVNTYNDTLRDLNAWRGAADWQKVAAWLLSLAKRFGNLTMTQLQRASRQLDDVVNGKYDWRISKFMEQHGLSR